MKRQWFIFLFSLFNIVTYAQAIGSFLDFHLGQSRFDVQNIVNTKYRGAEWNNNSCKINNISLAGEFFNQFTMEFQNGVITNAIFSRSFNNTWIEGYSNAIRFLENAQQEANHLISRLHATYASKYGKESTLTDNAIIWRGFNGNSIKISYIQQFVDHGIGGVYLVNCVVNVNYLSSNNDNF